VRVHSYRALSLERFWFPTSLLVFPLFVREDERRSSLNIQKSDQVFSVSSIKSSWYPPPIPNRAQAPFGPFFFFEEIALFCDASPFSFPLKTERFP